MFNKFIWLSLISITLFIVTTLMGYYGLRIKMTVIIILYSISHYQIYYYLFSRERNGAVATILLLPPILILLPLHILGYNDPWYSLPTTISYIFAIGFSYWFIFAISYRLAILLLFVGAGGGFVTVGYPYYHHLIQYCNLNGNTEYPLPPILLKSYNGTAYKLKSKLFTVLDFWNTGCTECFRKFPLLDSLYLSTKNQGVVEVLSVNVPLARDTIGQSEEMVRKRSYDFPILYIDDTDMLNIKTYPTVLVVFDNRVIFKGTLDGAIKMLRSVQISPSP
jgi:thiol-disulfide isomerase/thioredoxin